MIKHDLYPGLKTYVEKLRGEMETIPSSRKSDLEKISAFINERLAQKKPVKLTFICTHNSRRSHMGQIWAQAAAWYYGLDNLHTFSGGTEATAFHPNAVTAIKNAGFEVSQEGGHDNPVYAVRFAQDHLPLKVFSKRYDDAANPSQDFCAVMTCSDADENCPYIPGASLRIPITYEDPKLSDGTPGEAEAYAQRCRQIGREMFYIFEKVQL